MWWFCVGGILGGGVGFGRRLMWGEEKGGGRIKRGVV